MNKKYKIAGITLIVLALFAALGVYLHGHSIPVLHPAGAVGQKERGLLIVGLLLSAIVVLPTFALTIFIALRYRENNPKRSGKKIKYEPDFDHSPLFESIWWGVPILIIGILSVVAWNSSHSLDPYKKLDANKNQLVVQVVALDWKWLFVYPEQHVASVNLAEIPVNTPVEFQVTSDTIMNSFWVPSLGGQIYAMPGMITQLHLMTDKAGSYFGSPANIAGKGFSRMDFTVRAGSQRDFNRWIATARTSSRTLNAAAYTVLSKPSMSVPVSYYSYVPDGFVTDVAMRYMAPGLPTPGSEAYTPSRGSSVTQESAL
ncbi:MAG TPA: COX aromatic rich motif-containing protein [Candidatus Saccharimonadales bacterium]|nr:COX aromatic rich motif-containing protein [Candidatus Saccharimonadales bacterium]